jgi:hypothetical protein
MTEGRDLAPRRQVGGNRQDHGQRRQHGDQEHAGQRHQVREAPHAARLAWFRPVASVALPMAGSGGTGGHGSNSREDPLGGQGLPMNAVV